MIHDPGLLKYQDQFPPLFYNIIFALLLILLIDHDATNPPYSALLHPSAGIQYIKFGPKIQHSCCSVDPCNRLDWISQLSY